MQKQWKNTNVRKTLAQVKNERYTSAWVSLFPFLCEYAHAHDGVLSLNTKRLSLKANSFFLTINNIFVKLRH
jgi:hypothetical protein